MFQPQLTKPANNNKFYIQQPNGFNPCILGNSEHRDPYLNVLPNCVGWVVGRFNEAIGEKNCKYLGSTHAKNFIDLAKSQGLKTGKEPKLGSIIVWSNDKYGHVAFVEGVYSETEILLSQSGWESSLAMWTGIHKIGANGQWIEGYDYRWMKSRNYIFLGFIYPPKEIVEMTQAEFNKMMDNYLAEKAKLPASDYAKEALDWAKKEGIMTGDKNGNQMPQSFITRQDVATMLYRSSK